MSERSTLATLQQNSTPEQVCSGVILTPGWVHKHLRFARGAAWVRSILGCAQNKRFSKSYGAQGSNDAPWWEKKLKKIPELDRTILDKAKCCQSFNIL